MANEWNVSYPLDHTLISDVPGEIRKLKDSCKDQLDREHETPVDGDATGSEHSNGSAVAYEGTGTPTNRPDGATALADNAIDRGRLWLDDNYDPPMLKRWKAAAFEPVVGTHLSAYTDEDSDPTAMLKIHAYEAQTDGMAYAVCTDLDSGESIGMYVGTDDDPYNNGDLIDTFTSQANNMQGGVQALVAKGEFFEVRASGTAAVTILWKSYGTLSKPVDQD